MANQFMPEVEDAVNRFTGLKFEEGYYPFTSRFEGDKKLIQLALQDPTLPKAAKLRLQKALTARETPVAKPGTTDRLKQAVGKIAQPKIPPMPQPLKAAAPKKDWATGQVIPPAPVIPLRPTEEPAIAKPVEAVKPLGDTVREKLKPSTVSTPSVDKTLTMRTEPTGADTEIGKPPSTPTPLPTGTAKLEDEFTVPATPYIPTGLSDTDIGAINAARTTKPTEENLPPEAPSTELGKQVAGTLGSRFGLWPEARPGISGSFYAREPSAKTSKSDVTETERFEAPESVQKGTASWMEEVSKADAARRAAIQKYYGTTPEEQAKSPFAQDIEARISSQKQAYDQYLANLEGAKKAEMWDRIIGALGKITAGTVGLTGVPGTAVTPGIPAGLDVAGAYKFTPSVDRGQLAAEASKLKEMRDKQAEAAFKASQEKALGAPQAQFAAAMPSEEQMKMYELVSKLGGGKGIKTRTGTEETEGVGTKVIPPSAWYPSSAARKSKEDQANYEYHQGKRTLKQFQDELNPAASRHTSNVGGYPPLRTRSDSDYVSSRVIAIKKDSAGLTESFISRLLKANKKSPVAGEDPRQSTDADIHTILNPPTLDPESKEFIDWYRKVQEIERKAGVPSGILAKLPDDYYVEKRTGKTYRQYNPDQNPFLRK